jgi:hypothetical protein
MRDGCRCVRVGGGAAQGFSGVRGFSRVQVLLNQLVGLEVQQSVKQGNKRATPGRKEWKQQHGVLGTPDRAYDQHLVSTLLQTDADPLQCGQQATTARG